ncbi:MAG: transglycosylase domain-containing protein [Clostridiaceae bacterium]|nr:transglycosylase domain-containing protein [Clostridiaceae bacterium]
MSNENRNNHFDPILNIPTMEELDRQWQEIQAQQNAGKNNSKAAASSARNGQKRANARPSGNRQANAGSRQTASGRNTSRTAAGRPKNSSDARQNTGHQDDLRQNRLKKDTVNSSKAKGKKKKKKRFKKLRFFFKLFFLFLLLGILAVLVFFYFKYGDDLLAWKNEAKQLVEESDLSTFRASETSYIYGANKKLIVKLKGDKDTSYLEFEDIPQAAIDCMVVTEDRDFYEHSGISILSTLKAGVLYVKAKIMGDSSFSRGGSTITQQLAKNIWLSNEKSEERKIREMFIAYELEKKYTKDQIMEFYLNNICFANAHFGIEAASKAYFSKSAKDLSLAEIAFLCAIPNRPETYDPLKNYSNTNERKERILSQLLEEGKISAAEYSDAKYEKIVLDPAEATKTKDYMTTYAISCATKALMEQQGFEFQYEFDSDEEQEEYEDDYNEMYNECHSALYTGGYRIYTSLSSSKQKKLQKSVNQTLKGFTGKSDGVYKMQGAATCIDNETGFVVAIVGGRKQKDTVGYTLNRAFQSYRQPGSCFKPLVVYTPQLERGYTPDTIVDDTYFEGGPKNSGGTYDGKITLRRAVEKSKNVVAWKLFQELTPTVGLSYVLKMNFSQIVDSDYYPAASLGGLTNGVSTVEMASAYATIANDGIYREPTCIRKITDSSGNVVVNNTKNREQKQVYEENAARAMTDILTGVLSNGTAAGNGLTNMPSAGKTGTTSDQKDGWFCGYTPYYTTVVWVGYDSPQTLSDLYGSTYPLTIWRDYMEQIHSNLERVEFEAYDDGSSSSDSSTDDEEEDVQQYDPDITEEPDAAEVTATPEATKKVKKTKEPEATQEPTAEPTQEPQQEIDDDPEDIISDDDPEDIVE